MNAKKISLPELYYDSRTGNFWLKLASARFLELGARDIKIHLMRAGQRTDMENDIGLRNGDEMLADVQVDRFVDFAGPLAGHRAGIFHAPGGKRVLVTSEISPVQPKAGDCTKLDRFFGQLFGDQTRFILLWLKCAWESLTRGDFQPGQMLALCGPPGCGKSLFQALVTEILGGRSAKPYRYMTGQTHFNSDLAKAEHLMIEDENARVNFSARREFGTAIKNWTVNTDISIHAKGREAVNLPIFRRMTLSVNNEPENLMILPPVDASIADKLALIKCSPAKVGDDRKKTWDGLVRELPALVAMLRRLQIPREWRDDRFRVKAYHNPELLEALGETSEENRLESLIEEVIFSSNKKADEFEGTAVELEQALRNSPFCFAVDRLLSFPSACGTYLARLAAKQPERIQSHKNRGRTIWLIKKD